MTFSSSAHRPLAAAFAGLALAFVTTPASAGTFNVGPETVVRHLQDVRLQNGSGEPLYLGYTITYHWFGLPYSVSRGGYVLGVKDKPIRYDLDEARVVEWQAQGHVPSPLPVYQMSTADFVLGNLLWIVAGLLSLWYGGRALVFHRSAKPAALVVDETAKAAAVAMAQRAAQVARVQQAKPAVANVPSAVPAVPAPHVPPVAKNVQSAGEAESRPMASRQGPSQPIRQAEQLQPQQTQERPRLQEQIQALKQPAPRPLSQQASQLSQTMVTAMRLPVARTLCRVKALKVA